MASRRLIIAAVDEDTLSSQEIRRVLFPSFVNLWASAVAKTDRLGLLLNSTEIMPAGSMNIEESADVIHSTRDDSYACPSRSSELSFSS